MHRAGAIVVATLLASGAVAGCSTPATPSRLPATPSPAATAGGSAGPSAGPGESGSTGLPSQSETAFGTIWNDIPAGFPTPSGAEPAEAESGPTSATFLAPTPTAGVRAIAEFYRTAFGLAGFGTNVNDVEDGSFMLSAKGDDGCDVVVLLAPRGGETLVSVFYLDTCQFSWPAG